MKNILVPTDFSENSIQALKYAELLFSTLECNFYLLYVGSLLDTKNDVESFYETDQSDDNTKERLTELVKEIREHSTEAHHFFFPLHEYGFFIPTIKKHLEENDIDLIVMGTKGASGLKEKVVGSNAGDVITRVQCNTLVVPIQVELSKPREIAFPTDFKDDTFPGNYSFHTITNQKVKEAIQCFVESRDVDMMIMVAKNLNFIQQILFDSIVERISFHTKIPFYVIHE